jgi:nucleotide-binding universal stress UspA family protein
MNRERTFLVVVGYDGSEHSDLALRRAIQEAGLRDAELHVVHVEDVTPAVLHLPDGVTVSTLDLAATRREEVWAQGVRLLDFDGPISRVDLDGYPADELVDYCAEVSADLLVMGTRGRGRLATTFLGSTSLRALERAHCDVLIAKSAEG